MEARFALWCNGFAGASISNVEGCGGLLRHVDHLQQCEDGPPVPHGARSLQLTWLSLTGPAERSSGSRGRRNTALCRGE